MSKLIVIAFLVSYLNQNVIQQHELQHYIQIQYTGVEEYSDKQLFIVTEQVSAEIIDNRLKNMKLRTKKELSLRDRQKIWRAFFNTVQTDNKTFSKILDFVENNKLYFKQNEESHFLITINGEVYTLALVSQNEFFSKLLEYLKLENCDSFLIQQISAIKLK